MTKISDVMLNMFKHEAAQAHVVLGAAQDIDMTYMPIEGMRTLKALANHLAQIPTLDPSMYRAEIEDGEQAQAKEKELWRDELDDIIALFNDGIKSVEAYFDGMSDDAFMEANLQPFYMKDEKKSWAYYFAEFTTHISMHKMQLWMYLKLAGANVNMMTYYGVQGDS